MRFPQLPIGQRFRWQGVTYTKTRPIGARGEADGAERMIPRSAVVEPLDGSPPQPPRSPGTLDPDSVRAAIDSLVQDIHTAHAALPSGTAERLAPALADAHRRCLERLGL